jgi:hypothetical protein
LGAGILLLITAAWFAVYYWLNPHVAEPDGEARVLGTCGDIMEIRLKFKDYRAVEGSSWTNGCAHSFNCVCAAVDLAKGKSPDEILDIDPSHDPGGRGRAAPGSLALCDSGGRHPARGRGPLHAGPTEKVRDPLTPPDNTASTGWESLAGNTCVSPSFQFLIRTARCIISVQPLRARSPRA